MNKHYNHQIRRTTITMTIITITTTMNHKTIQFYKTQQRSQVLITLRLKSHLTLYKNDIITEPQPPLQLGGNNFCGYL